MDLEHSTKIGTTRSVHLKRVTRLDHYLNSRLQYLEKFIETPSKTASPMTKGAGSFGNHALSPTLSLAQCRDGIDIRYRLVPARGSGTCFDRTNKKTLDVHETTTVVDHDPRVWGFSRWLG